MRILRRVMLIVTVVVLIAVGISAAILGVPRAEAQESPRITASLIQVQGVPGNGMSKLLVSTMQWIVENEHTGTTWVPAGHPGLNIELRTTEVGTQDGEDQKLTYTATYKVYYNSGASTDVMATVTGETDPVNIWDAAYRLLEGAAVIH
jgi:hypothetical protein